MSTETACSIIFCALFLLVIGGCHENETTNRLRDEQSHALNVEAMKAGLEEKLITSPNGSSMKIWAKPTPPTP